MREFRRGDLVKFNRFIYKIVDDYTLFHPYPHYYDIERTTLIESDICLFQGKQIVNQVPENLLEQA